MLTGFKWLAKIPNLRFGYEEALGYAVDATSVNDKDGISAALMIAQCAAELKAEGRTIADYLDEIAKLYGFHTTEQISIRVKDMAQVDLVLSKLRAHPPTAVAGFSCTQIDDLMQPMDGLPPTNGLRYWFGEDIRVIIRPSGTEAKMKCYIEVCAEKGEARALLHAVSQDMKALLN